jgi:proteic killer suppression protein
MIKTFADKETEQLFSGQFIRKLPKDIQKTALRKLVQLHAATELEFLRIPPGNKLEMLRGDRSGQYSIRINDQWRICFSWHNGGAYVVEIIDYH